MGLKKIIRCKHCKNRVIDDGVGFVRERKLLCGYFDLEVDPNDGCTFGKEGDSKYSSKRPMNVDIGGESATQGDKSSFYKW